MKKQQVILRGYNYIGRFSFVQEKIKFLEDDLLEDIYRWFGTGIIKNFNTNKFYEFLITTFYENKKNKKLLECLIKFEEDRFRLLDIILNTETRRKYFYDLFLEKIYENVKNNKNSGDFNLIYPQEISYKELTNNRLL